MLVTSTIIESNKSFVIYRRFDGNQTVHIPVSNDQELSPVQIVAQAKQETGYEIVPVAEALGLNSTDISSCLAVEVGDSVKLGSLLAEQKKLFGRARHITSTVEGTIAEIVEGNIFISRAPDDVNLRALVSGRVVDVIPNTGVAIEVQGSRLQGVWSNGLESAGRLLIQADAPDAQAAMAALDGDLYRSIVVLGQINNPKLLELFAEAGARGVIAGTASAEVYHAAADWGLPFILTDGVGSSGMYSAMFQLLSENSGKDVALFNGKYSLTGRPEVIINKRPDTEDGTTYHTSRLKRAEPAIGQTVRLLTGEKRGRNGTIVKLHSWPMQTPSGIKAEGVDVELDSGELFFVPFANLDIIM